MYRGQNGWLGGSTDGPGFARAIQRLGKTLGSFERVVFLGSGGVVLSILEHLADMASESERVPSKITILRRSKIHDEKMVGVLEAASKLEILDLFPQGLSS